MAKKHHKPKHVDGPEQKAHKVTKGLSKEIKKVEKELAKAVKDGKPEAHDLQIQLDRLKMKNIKK